VTTKGPRVIGDAGRDELGESRRPVLPALANERLVRERLGGLHSARVLLASVDFADIEQLQAGGRWGRGGSVAELPHGGPARGLGSPGEPAELLLICTRNEHRMHKVADQVPGLSRSIYPTAEAPGRRHRAGDHPRRVEHRWDCWAARRSPWSRTSTGDRLASHGFTVARATATIEANVRTASSTTSCAWVCSGRNHGRSTVDVITRLVQAGAEGGRTRLYRDRTADLCSGQSSVPVFFADYHVYTVEAAGRRHSHWHAPAQA